MFIVRSFLWRKWVRKCACKIHLKQCCTTMHPNVVQLYLLMSYVHNSYSRTTWQPHNKHNVIIGIMILCRVSLGISVDWWNILYSCRRCTYVWIPWFRTGCWAVGNIRSVLSYTKEWYLRTRMYWRSCRCYGIAHVSNWFAISRAWETNSVHVRMSVRIGCRQNDLPCWFVLNNGIYSFLPAKTMGLAWRQFQS